MHQFTVRTIISSLSLSHPLSLDAPAVEDITSRRLCADDFTTEKVIGRGAFGEVQLVSLIAKRNSFNLFVIHSGA